MPPKLKTKSNVQRPFWLDVENMLNSQVLTDGDDGHLKGTMTGESWKNFLIELRAEILCKLENYGTGAYSFQGSHLGNFRADKKKIERIYLRSLAVLYRDAEKAYKNISG